MNRTVTALLMLSMTFAGWGEAAEPRLTVRVTVQDESGRPIPDAEVIGGFRQLRSVEVIRERSDAKGQAELTGRTAHALTVAARKAGYYESRSPQIKPYDIKDGQRLYRDPAPVTLDLRPIKNPIPMYARKFSDGLRVPNVGTPVGFDLVEGDWVAPYGQGRTADFMFKLAGFWKSPWNYESVLTLSFSNAGDGLVPFEAHPTSEFASPYEAPEAGYQPQKTWRRSRTPKPGPGTGPGSPGVTVVDETSKEANYAFRVRTVRNADGTIRSALYGKLYGDPEFLGPDDAGRNHVVLTYYLNPTPNDRNLECDWRKNLAQLREGVANPQRP